MSFVHVLGQIGRGVLKAAPIIASTLNPAVGALVTAGAAVAQAEVDKGPGNGAAKQEQALTQITSAPALASSPIVGDQRVAQIKILIDSIVATLNAVAALFPASAPPKT
jgi:hypothetical protein